jgi:hypothetical protein
MLKTVPFKGTVYKTAELPYFQKFLLRSKSILNIVSLKGTVSKKLLSCPSPRSPP